VFALPHHTTTDPACLSISLTPLRRQAEPKTFLFDTPLRPPLTTPVVVLESDKGIRMFNSKKATVQDQPLRPPLTTPLVFLRQHKDQPPPPTHLNPYLNAPRTYLTLNPPSFRRLTFRHHLLPLPHEKNPLSPKGSSSPSSAFSFYYPSTKTSKG
jgi:hypothetical protein